MNELAAHLTRLADSLLGQLTEPQRHAAVHPFDGPERTRWTYLPRPRPGVPLHALNRPARKIVHQMVAAVLSRHAFAQAVTIMAWEEVLDVQENGRRNRCGDDHHVALFGTPGRQVWAWRLEGHHLSVTTALTSPTPGSPRAQVVVAPVFLGINPARIHSTSSTPDQKAERAAESLVLAPLGGEEDLARCLLTTLPAALRDRAVTNHSAPPDLHSGTAPAIGDLEPAGLSARDLPAAARTVLSHLMRLYLGRLTTDLAEPLAAAVEHDGADVHFAWEGHPDPGHDHAYRIQLVGPARGHTERVELLAEYCNTSGGSHAHTVLRAPGHDFGTHLLPR